MVARDKDNNTNKITLLYKVPMVNSGHGNLTEFIFMPKSVRTPLSLWKKYDEKFHPATFVPLIELIKLLSN